MTVNIEDEEKNVKKGMNISTTSTGPINLEFESLKSPSADFTSKQLVVSLHDVLLEIIDVLISCLIVAPCVIAYWRGTWELIGVILFPTNPPVSAFCSFIIGGFGHMFFSLTQRYFTYYIHPDKHRLTYYLVSRVYTYIYGMVCVNMWRGSWILCDWLTSANSLYIICAVTIIALIFLIITRTVRNLLAAPFSIIMDHKSDYFTVETMFNTSSIRGQRGLYIIDMLFSIYVVGTLVVISWRGLWGIVDLTVYPSDRTKSASCSLLMGAITVCTIFTIYPLMRWLTKHIDGIFKLILLDLYYLMQFFGAINTWRGIWILLDVFLYPDNRLLSYELTHSISFLILTALKCSNSILVRGVYVDCNDINNNNDCVNIPIQYVKLHFQRERYKRKYMMMNSHQISNIRAYHHKQQLGENVNPQSSILPNPSQEDYHIREMKLLRKA